MTDWKSHRVVGTSDCLADRLVDSRKYTCVPLGCREGSERRLEPTAAVLLLTPSGRLSILVVVVVVVVTVVLV